MSWGAPVTAARWFGRRRCAVQPRARRLFGRAFAKRFTHGVVVGGFFVIAHNIAARGFEIFFGLGRVFDFLVEGLQLVDITFNHAKTFAPEGRVFDVKAKTFQRVFV